MAICALALAVGCVGKIAVNPPGAQSTTGGPVGSGGSGTTNPGTGGTKAPVDVGTIVVNPPPFSPAPAMLRRRVLPSSS